MPIATDMVIRTAHADVTLDMAFSESVRGWHRRECDAPAWKSFPATCGPLLIGKDNGVVVEGDCLQPISAPDGGVIHINGNLASSLDVSLHCEIVVTGDVSPSARIQSSGFLSLFVGGRFAGELQTSGSAKIWIESHFTGTIKTGEPSTKIVIGGDCDGSIAPYEDAALLWLTVGGFASQESLKTISGCGYARFQASIARSDVAAGLYPLEGGRKTVAGRNSSNCWCVRSTGVIAAGPAISS